MAKVDCFVGSDTVHVADIWDTKRELNRLLVAIIIWQVIPDKNRTN